MKSKDLYIFLDFDGVLHLLFPMKGFSEKENEHFHKTNEVAEALIKLEEKFNIKVVISSSWRKKRTVFELKQIIAEKSAWLSSKIVGKTPVIEVEKEEGMRQREIEAWLENNSVSDACWLAIDDYPTWFDANEERVVLCDLWFDEKSSAYLMKQAEKMLD